MKIHIEQVYKQWKNEKNIVLEYIGLDIRITVTYCYLERE